MIKKQSNLNIKLSKFFVAIGLLISINGIDAAEGGPSKIMVSVMNLNTL